MENSGNRGHGGRGRGGYKGNKPFKPQDSQQGSLQDSPQHNNFTFTPAKQADGTESHGGGGRGGRGRGGGGGGRGGGGRGGGGRGGRGGGHGEHSVVPKVKDAGHIGKKSTISCSSLQLDLPRPVSGQTNMEFFISSVLSMSEMFRMQRTSEEIPDLLRMVEAEIRNRMEKAYERFSCPTDKFVHWVYHEQWILLSYALNRPEDGWDQERDFNVISRCLYYAFVDKEFALLQKMVAQCKVSGIDMLMFYDDIFQRLNRLGKYSVYRPMNEESFKLMIDYALECAVDFDPTVEHLAGAIAEFRDPSINYARGEYATIIARYCLQSYHSRLSVFAVKYLLPMIDMTPEVLKTIVDDYRWGLKCIHNIETVEIRESLLLEAIAIYDFILSLHGDKMSVSSILNGTEEQIIPNELLAIIGYSPLMLTA